MYCGALGMLFLRSSHFLAISQVLGPKLQMIRSMVADLRVFFWLMIIFLFSQGVILKSLEDPNQPAPTTRWELYQLVYDISFVPYFQIYGELFIEDFSNDEKIEVRSIQHYKRLNFTSGRKKDSYVIINYQMSFFNKELIFNSKGSICEEEECCFAGKSYNKPKFQEVTGLDVDLCYRNPKLSVLATMFYMVIANVIMLNILIAMFSHRYEAVQ